MRCVLLLLLTAPALIAAAPVVLEQKTPLLEFRYGWPAAAAGIAKLDGRLRADAQTGRQKALNMAREDRASRDAAFPFNPHNDTKLWEVAGDTAGLLVLTAEHYTFTGGAHGMTVYEGIVWDRPTARNIAVWSLFRDPARAKAVVARLFCPRLDAERAKKRGEPVRHVKGEDWDTACPDPTKYVVVPGEVRGGRFTALRVILPPYEAGPYAEGTYEVRVPVTPALAALLKPERRPAFGG